jgi:hypothetical protein
MASVSWVTALTAMWLAGPTVPTPAGGSPVASSYESLAKGAVRTHDVATVLGVFVDRCDAEKRDLDRARCRAVGAYLRRTLPEQTFSLNSEDPAAISVSDYDASIKGYHVSLAGCIACTAPVPVGRGSEPRFVTLKVPDKEKDGQPLAKAVPVSRNTFGFDSLAEAKRWLDAQRPYMRAEFLFQPRAVDAEWKFGDSQGVAVKLVGARILNRCTGQVLVSNPASEHAAERANPDREPSCRTAPKNVSQVVPPEDLPLQLSKSMINDAMANINTRVFACYQRYRSPGRLELTYVVTGAGNVQSVVLGAAYAGTPTGLCVLEVAKDAHFPQFRLDHQKFTFPFFLRD